MYERMMAVTVALLVGGCTAETPRPATIRLVDVAAEATIEDTPAATEPPAPIEWTFADGETHGWTAGGGIEGLTVRDGALVGRTTDAMPMLHLAWEATMPPEEPLHAVEVRMAASQPGRMRVEFVGAPGPFNPAMARTVLSAFSRGLEAPLTPGEEAQTYMLQTDWGTTAGSMRHLVVVPADAAGNEFRIESVRLVFRRQHLAGIPSGIGWQGLGEIYRETIVARTPETWRFDLDLPARPLLDLAVGTVEHGPVRFRATVRKGEEAVTIFERTVTRPHRWEPVQADLSRWAGRRVELALTVAADAEGALGFWGAPAVRSGVDPAATERPQGVILIAADTLRRDHLSTYGYERQTSPVLTRLAGEGTLFRDVVAQATWTKASMSSILTSLYPSSHGVTDFDHRMSAAAETLAEAYREAGYATMSQIAVPFVGRFTNLHQGFEVVHEPGSLPDEIDSKTARESMDRLLPWIEAHRDVPFFTLLHVFDPHDPYEPYAPYDALWTEPGFEPEFERQLEAIRPHIADPLMRLFGAPSRAEMEAAGVAPGPYVGHEKGWYDGSIRAMDVEIGRLIERLEELGLADRVLIVFVSDHGEEFLEHGRHFHGQSVYGELSRVPLVLHGPGVPPGQVIAPTVQTIDLMPTLLELSGLPVPDGVQGRSLVPLLAEGTAERWDRPAITEKHATTHTAGPFPRHTAATAIVLGGWKLVHHAVREADGPEFELFARSSDPLDAHDVAAEHPEVVERLRRALESWRTAATAARLPDDAESAEGLSAADRERLRALGYL